MLEHWQHWATRFVAYGPRWGAVKDWLVARTGLTHDALHVHASLAIFVACAIVLRRRRRWWLAWLAVFILELGNETLDMSGGGDESTLAASIHDIKNTMVWPTILLLIGWLWLIYDRRVAARRVAPVAGPVAGPVVGPDAES